MAEIKTNCASSGGNLATMGCYASQKARCKQCVKQKAAEYRNRPDILKKRRVHGGRLSNFSERLERDIATFWKNVFKSDGCWEWIGPMSGDGYGRFTSRAYKKRFRAHRISLLFAGVKLPDEMLACHHCDNPKCVRPDHLFVGTYLDNNSDCAKKGRAKAEGKIHLGTDNPKAKLNEAKVADIRRMVERGITKTQAAKEYGVSVASISAVVLRKTWKSVA